MREDRRLGVRSPPPHTRGRLRPRCPIAVLRSGGHWAERRAQWASALSSSCRIRRCSRLPDQYERSIVVFREARQRQSLTMLDHNLGHVQQYKGNYDDAIAIYRKALVAYYDIGDLGHQAIALSDIGAAFGSKGCFTEALVHHQKSAELAEAIGDRSQLAAALCGAGDAHRGLGSYGAATESYEQAPASRR